MAFHSTRPFWPRGSPSPPAGAWARWTETFIDNANLLPIVNNFILTEVLKLKLLRLILGENRQTSFGARRLNEASSIEDALRQLNNFWGTNGNIFAAFIDPMYDNEDDLLYRQCLKDLLLKHYAESRNFSTISASPLKVLISVTAK